MSETYEPVMNPCYFCDSKASIISYVSTEYGDGCKVHCPIVVLKAL